MDTQRLIEALTGDGGDPGHRVPPAEKLRLLAALGLRTAELAAEIAAETTSPTAGGPPRPHRRTHPPAGRSRPNPRRTHRPTHPRCQNSPPKTSTRYGPSPRTLRHSSAGASPFPRTRPPSPPGSCPSRTPADFLQHALHLPRHTARDRLHAANALLPATDIHGNPAGPRYPRLAAPLLKGTTRLGPTAAAARTLDKLAPAIAAQPEPRRLAERLEEQVAGSVAAGIPQATSQLFTAIGDELEDAATDKPPTPREIRAKTGIFITKRTKHYTYMSLCMLNADAEVFLAHFAASDNPRTLAGNRQALAAAATGLAPATGSSTPSSTPSTGDTGNDADRAPAPKPGSAASPGPGPDWFDHPEVPETFGDPDPPDTRPDGLTPPQRHLQTLLNLMRAPAAAPPRGTTGLPTAQLLIHCRLDTLLGLAKGNGWSAHGLQIPIGEIRRRLATDGVIPVVLGGQGEVLDLGREMRFATDPIRRAVLARDGGCFYPGCSVPPEHLEMCHLDGWAAGGGTSVAGLTPGCTSHHHMADNGLLTLLIHNGLPHVILPRHLDPGQLPRRNTYWPQNQATLF